MKRSLALPIALLGGIAFAVAGCATHGPHPTPADMAGSGFTPGADSGGAVAGPAMPNVAEGTAAGSDEIAGVSYRVGDVGDAPTPVASHVGDCPPAGSTVAGNMAAGNMVAGNTAACPSGTCPPSSPYGYAPQPTTYNLYGIDPQEFLCDGGDHPPPARLTRNDRIIGLQAEDTVVHGTNTSGEIEFRASNRVCLYAPRFASVRKITGAASGQRVVGAVGVDGPVGPNRIDILQPRLTVTEQLAPARSEATRRLDAMRERNRGVPVEGVRQLEQATDVLAAVAGIRVLEIDRLRRDELAVLQRAATNAVTWSTNLTLEVAVDLVKPPVLTQVRSVEGVTVYDFPDTGRLQIVKLADRHQAQPGDTVTFMIRVDNVGDSPIDHVVVTDNLTTRLEYVEGSQECDVDAAFLAEPNAEGSVRLEWKLDGELAVGDAATIRFECLVR